VCTANNYNGKMKSKEGGEGSSNLEAAKANMWGGGKINRDAREERGERQSPGCKRKAWTDYVGKKYMIIAGH